MHLEPFAIPTFPFNGDAKHSGIYQSKQYALQFLSLMFCKKEAVRAKKEEKVHSQFSCFFLFHLFMQSGKENGRRLCNLGHFLRGKKKGNQDNTLTFLQDSTIISYIQLGIHLLQISRCVNIVLPSLSCLTCSLHYHNC